MQKSELYKLMGIKLDLAVEAHEILRGEVGREIPGVKMDEERYENAVVKTITILDEQGAQIMGRAPGTYVTLESREIRDNNKMVHKQIGEILANKLKEILPLREDSTVLIVGLGNWNATPDALGPKVVELSMATRHLFHYAPEELRQGLRSVCVLAPGVLGLTGIETAEIIKGTVDRVQPDLVICIDALAAGSVERINSSLQVATTGINPGSGVGNKRIGINQETMGVPVVAIGVPTVVHAGIIAHQAMEKLFNHLQTTPALQDVYHALRPVAVNEMINDVLEPFGGQLMVTPKEIDEQISNTARIIAMALAMALHPGMPEDEVEHYLH
ncbi:MAG: GPR endopeptidase [Bacillota bacterium]|uniref:Germination protease n=1 Tax=Thermanaerosceptrum fracticalcis TaxID=1712410 RepID=A0A7G6E1K8_THEFR|nr:GPR endopeptidase [Thermanaerosceptrum fracticalcis]QNB45962.1 GPR endopeptidase [Thermanaerosceptrum fracticalcis]